MKWAIGIVFEAVLVVAIAWLFVSWSLVMLVEAQ